MRDSLSLTRCDRVNLGSNNHIHSARCWLFPNSKAYLCSGRSARHKLALQMVAKFRVLLRFFFFSGLALQLSFVADASTRSANFSLLPGGVSFARLSYPNLKCLSANMLARLVLTLLELLFDFPLSPRMHVYQNFCRSFAAPWPCMRALILDVGTSWFAYCVAHMIMTAKMHTIRSQNIWGKFFQLA